MTPERLLKKGLNQSGFFYTEGQIKAFMTFLSELKKWNRTYNLTALKTDEDIIVKHFLDSLLYLKAIHEVSRKSQVASHKSFNPPIPPLLKGGEGGFSISSLVTEPALSLTKGHSSLKIADVGSGAGFPGIPIKIIRPEIEITLIESSRKKAAFLRHIIRVLGLKGIRVLELRIENLGRNYQKTFDIILSRATFKIQDFLKKTCPYLREDGILVLSKGPGVSEETREIKAVEKTLRFELPFIKSQRNLVVLKC